MMTEDKRPLLSVRALKRHFALPRRLLGGPTQAVQAVDGVSFNIAEGEHSAWSASPGAENPPLHDCCSALFAQIQDRSCLKRLISPRSIVHVGSPCAVGCK